LIEKLPPPPSSGTPPQAGGESVHYKVIAHETISQMNLHREWGGVYPTLSRREHEKNLVPLLHKVLKDAGLLKNKTQSESLNTFDEEIVVRDDDYIIEKLGNQIELLERYPDLKENVFDFFSKFELSEKIDFLAVTNGPGLPPALWVGVNFAKVISILFGHFEKSIPIYPINHMEGHIIGAVSKSTTTPGGQSHVPRPPGVVVQIPDLKYPALCLLISGGHTELVLNTEPQKYQKIGETQDDAVGEAYDKVARLLGLPYPGGPEIGRLAKVGRDTNVKSLDFPRPMIHSKDLNFSFSGLKTHILYYTQKIIDSPPLEGGVDVVRGGLDEQDKIEIATEFEEAVKDVLIYKTRKAISETGAQTLVVGGGVASNTYLKENFEKLANEIGVELYISTKELSTDNALMIALTCANQIENGLPPTKEFLAIGSKNYEWK
jgi:N6-L-threonylcarbamoyladenine synthase